MRQTAAIFLDAYRELNSKKLFWIVMILSVGVVAILGCLGISKEGMTFLWFEIPSMMFNERVFSKDLFYKTLFTSLGVKIWLAWASTILAIVATAGIFPDLISSGSIELTLSRPISRVRLFLTKYATGLLFTAIQVAAFTFASFLVLGLRGGVWAPGIFWTIPLMVVFFSYLFAISTFLGILTRSTLAAMLLTILLWFVIFLAHSGERSLLMFREITATQKSKITLTVSQLEKAVGDYRSAAGPDAQLPPHVSRMSERIERLKPVAERIDKRYGTIDKWHSIMLAGMTILPKTSETLEVLDRVLVSQADMDQLRSKDEPDDVPVTDEEVPVNPALAAERVQDIQRARSLWWIIGTSLGFEAVLLTISGWIFSRRDF